MTATQAMTGQGGWPMTVFMTPDKEPFFCGTYFPRDYFQQLVLNVSRAWPSQRDDVTGQAKQVAEALAENAAATARALREAGQGVRVPPGQAERPVPPGRGRGRGRARRDYDAAGGGFGGAPKFPPSMVLEFLLRHHQRTGDPAALRMAGGTCEAMARGGMYDQLGGGFARYSVDAGWVVPHFEKMLYDNALLARVYAEPVAPHRLRTGPAGGGGDLRLDAARAADARGRSRRVPGRRQRGRRRKVLRLAPRRTDAPSSAPRTASSPPGPSASPRPARSSMAPPCCSGAPSPPTRTASPASGTRCWPPGTPGSGPAGTTRWSPRGTGWPSPRWPNAGCCCPAGLHRGRARRRHPAGHGAPGRRAARPDLARRERREHRGRARGLRLHRRGIPHPVRGDR